MFIYTVLPCRKPHGERSHSKWKSYELHTHCNASLSFWTCPFREILITLHAWRQYAGAGFIFRTRTWTWKKISPKQQMNEFERRQERALTPISGWKMSMWPLPLLLHVFVILSHWAVVSHFNIKWLLKWWNINEVYRSKSTDLADIEMLHTEAVKRAAETG